MAARMTFCGFAASDQCVELGILDSCARTWRFCGWLPGDQPMGPAAGISAEHAGAAQSRAADSLRRDAGALCLRRFDWQNARGEDDGAGAACGHGYGGGVGFAAAL